jgi:hypothetical protein
LESEAMPPGTSAGRQYLGSLLAKKKSARSADAKEVGLGMAMKKRSPHRTVISLSQLCDRSKEFLSIGVK